MIKRGKGQYVRAHTVRKLVVEMETKLRDAKINDARADAHKNTNARKDEEERKKSKTQRKKERRGNNERE